MFQKLKDKTLYAFAFAPVLAQDINISAEGNFSALENLTPASLVSGAISLVLLIVALVFFFMLIWGGLRWVMSQGDQKNVETARNQITNALIGLAIVFAAFAIMKLIGAVFGIDLFNFEIPSLQP
jgi:TRAP-type C4-dicarboxylate transport system permease small subunit